MPTIILLFSEKVAESYPESENSDISTKVEACKKGTIPRRLCPEIKMSFPERISAAN